MVIVNEHLKTEMLHEQEVRSRTVRYLKIKEEILPSVT